MKLICAMLAIFITSVSLTVISCKQDKRANLLYKDFFVYNTFRDTCVFIKDSDGDTINFHRRFKILENTFTDTLNISFKWIPPGTLGERFATQIERSTSNGLPNEDIYIKYIEDNDLPVLYTKSLCFYHLSGKIKLRSGQQQQQKST